jgi:hypothetical protein
MNEQIKLTEVEVKEIRGLQDSFQKKIFQIGQLRLNKLKMEKSLAEIVKTEEKLMSEWTTLETNETTLIDTLLKKYGEGALDLTSGTFTPDKK